MLQYTSLDYRNFGLYTHNYFMRKNEL